MNVEETVLRISIALEGHEPHQMRLLVAREHISQSAAGPDSSVSAAGNELGAESSVDNSASPTWSTGELTCSYTTWLRIKGESSALGATWATGMTRRKQLYWSSKPIITQIRLWHHDLDMGSDPQLTLSRSDEGEIQITGSLEGRLMAVTIREGRTAS